MMKLMKLCAASLLLVSSSVFAHTGLKASIPADKAMLDQAPTELSLTFGAKVKLLGLTLVDSKGTKLLLDFKAPKEMQTAFTQKLPVLKPEIYTVEWVMMGQDTHKMTGKLGFMVHGPNGTMPH
ncbi:copper resistance CopC family protein [Thiothrix eikelboomii]|uniref:copper resistance CopC family protein n=1 Tax=Thiothrix eikelboomii TaxID=92487 RepID=UPI003BB05CE0